MATTTIKTAEELAKALPLADGVYTYEQTKGTEKTGSVVTVSDTGAKYTVVSIVNQKSVTVIYTLEEAKAALTEVVAQGYTLTFTPKPAEVTEEKKETPWLLYAAGAAVLYLLLRKK